MKAKMKANRSAVGHFSILATSSDDDENSVEELHETKNREIDKAKKSFAREKIFGRISKGWFCRGARAIETEN